MFLFPSSSHHFDATKKRPLDGPGEFFEDKLTQSSTGECLSWWRINLCSIYSSWIYSIYVYIPTLRFRGQNLWICLHTTFIYQYNPVYVSMFLPWCRNKWMFLRYVPPSSILWLSCEVHTILGHERHRLIPSSGRPTQAGKPKMCFLSLVNVKSIEKLWKTMKRSTIL